MNRLTLHALFHVLLGMSLASLTAAAGQAETRHVWEKVEITLQSQRPYENPYTDVQVWLRYQANICLFSPIHFDTPAQSIAADDWNAAANLVIERYGHPPFGTLAGTNSNPSSLQNWGHTDRARWLGFHQIGNRRTHDVYECLTEIFQAQPPVPGINGEPYCDGMEDAEPGSDKAARYCRSAMYGSALSGALGGYIYGAGGWKGGLWSGEVETASEYPIWEVIQWPSADQMRHLKTFVLSEGRRYQDLIPSVDLLSPSRSGKAESLNGWAYCAATASRDLVLLYFEQDCPRPTLSGLPAGRSYQGHWYDPRTGRWLEAAPATETITATADGTMRLPPFPAGGTKSHTDWALKLRSRSEQKREGHKERERCRSARWTRPPGRPSTRRANPARGTIGS